LLEIKHFADYLSFAGRFLFLFNIKYSYQIDISPDIPVEPMDNTETLATLGTQGKG
jgi:hypothetical protein